MAIQEPAQPPWRVSWDIQEDARASYCDADLERIERSVAGCLGKDCLDPFEREGLFNAVFDEAVILLIEKQGAAGRPPLQEVKKRLHKIKTASETLIDTINAADDLSLYFLLQEFGKTHYIRCKGDQPYALDIDQVLSNEIDGIGARLEVLQDILQASDRAFKCMPAVKPGTKPDWATHRYIRRMAGVFKSFAPTGKTTVSFDAYSEPPRYHGPFFEFIEACFTPIDPHAGTTNQALGELIRRALRLR